MRRIVRSKDTCRGAYRDAGGSRGEAVSAHKLKPCPFCWSGNIELRCFFIENFYTCLTCRAHGPRHENANTARDLWNRRPHSGFALVPLAVLKKLEGGLLGECRICGEPNVGWEGHNGGCAIAAAIAEAEKS